MRTPSELATAPIRRPLWRRWLPVAIWLVVIFFASTAVFVPEHTSRIIDPILRVLLPNADEGEIGRMHILVRKAGHLTEYAILAILLSRAVLCIAELRLWWFGVSLLLLALVAASDEFHQSFVPGRNASVGDVMIDITGGLIVLLLIAACHRLRRPAAATTSQKPVAHTR